MRLQVSSIAEAARAIDPVFLGSPQLEHEPLGARLGCRLTLKVETVNPIRSFKGRGAEWFAAGLADRAPLVCASAGNFGQAMAYACRKRGIPLTVFAARTASAVKIARIRELGAAVELAGDDFEAAKQAARAAGGRFVEDGREPAIAEGAGTIAVELLGRGERFDAVVVPVGDGALLGGVARWIRHAAPGTRVIGACSRGAPAMYHAWRGGDGAGAAASAAAASTIADGIAVRVPVPESVADLRELADEVVLVDDATLIAAMRLVHLHAGLVIEPSAAAGLAAILEDRASFAGLRVATVLTGGNLTPEQLRSWIAAGEVTP